MTQPPPQHPIPQTGTYYGYEQEGEPIDLLRYWLVIRKNLAGILGLAFAVGILAMLYANSLTPIYTATTRVSIEHVSPSTGGYTDNSWYMRQNYPGTQYEIIKSRSVADQVVENLKLWEHPFFQKKQEEKKGFSLRDLVPSFSKKEHVKKAVNPEELLKNKKRGLSGMVQGGISITPIEDTFVINLSYSSTSPELAALIANGIVDAYIQQKLDSKFKEVEKISDWMNESLGGISSQLEESEQKLQSFRSREDIINVGDQGASGLLKQRLDGVSSKLVQARIDYNELKVLKRQADRFRNMPLDELLNNQSIYKHPTLKEVKDTEIELSRKVIELKKRYGPKHPKMIQANDELDAIRGRYKELIPSIIGGIDEDHKISGQNLASLEREYSSLKKQVQGINVKEFELERLQREVEGNRKMHELYMEEYKQTSMSSKFESDRVRVVDPAVTPGAPSRPNKRRIIMTWVLLALLAGIGLAFLIEYLDQTIKTSEDVEAKLKLATLGLLPLLKKRDIEKGTIQPERLYVDDEKSNFSEAIRTIRTGLTLSAIDSPHKVILVTSSAPGEGKTTVASNTALSFAQLEKTLIFDADLRRPSTNKIFGYDHNDTGMSDLLSGNAEFKDVIHKVEGADLHVITAGTIPPDPLDLLASKKFKHLLEELTKRYDRIIIDSPPVSLVSDPILLASLVDAVVYVIKADDTNTKLIGSSLRKLKQADAHIVGAVLNAVNMKKLSKYYGYGYGKYYGDGYYTYGSESKNT